MTDLIKKENVNHFWDNYTHNPNSGKRRKYNRTATQKIEIKVTENWVKRIVG